MRPHPFDHLREPLLRAGIRPRHVNRYLTELAEHYYDAVQDEERRGASAADAVSAARLRMGSDQHLMQGVLARPELLAFSVRYPWAVYGLGSLLGFAGALAAVGLLTMLFLTAAAVIVIRTQTAPDVSNWMINAMMGFRIFALHGLPLILGAVIVLNATRQRMPALWPVIGLIVISLFGALTNFDFTAGPPGHRQLTIGAGFSLAKLEQTTIHMAANLAVLLALYAAAAQRLRNKSPG
jgi:hypothetical protein